MARKDWNGFASNARKMRMTAAAIAAQLVDMRNVGTHKVMKLTIHVPEEQALAAIAAFGWPTGVNPVPIAIARLNPGADAKQTLAPSTKSVDIPDSAVHVPNREFDSPDRGQLHPDGRPEWNGKSHHPRQETQPVDGAKTRMAFRDLRMANQAGILCDTPAFHRFLAEKVICNPDLFDAKQAADYVRRHCNVASRSDIRPRTPSGDRWSKLVDEYRTWMHMPELVA